MLVENDKIVKVHYHGYFPETKEVFDSSLDGFGTDEFMKIIRFVIKDANIFVISHKTDLHDKFENVIRFEKVKGFSHMASGL